MVSAWSCLFPVTLAVRPSLWDPRLLAATLALAAAILIGAVLFAWLNHWRRRNQEASPVAQENLAHFHELYEQGRLSQEEFGRIRARLAPQLRHELGLGAQSSSTGPPEASQGPSRNHPHN